MKLTSQNVKDVVMDCLFTKDEVPAGGQPEKFVAAHGVMLNAAFHPERLESHREDVKSMLAELPESFHDKGDSFLALGFDKNGDAWGEHQSMDTLMVLGLALGYIKMFPRALWNVLPGGMPVLTIKL